MLTKLFSLGVRMASKIKSKQQGSKHKNRVSTEPKKTLTRAPFHAGVNGLIHGWEKKPGELRSQAYDSNIQVRATKETDYSKTNFL